MLETGTDFQSRRSKREKVFKKNKKTKQEGMFFCSLLFWLSQTFKRVNMFPAGMLHDFDSHCAETDLRHI